MTQYIEKNKVLMWIMEELNSYQPTEITSGKYALTSAVDFINTLETKDIDKINKTYEEIIELLNTAKYLLRGHKQNLNIS